MRHSVIWTGRGPQTGAADHEANIFLLRDGLRDALAATSFVVSDFAKWDGSSVGAIGYAFIVKNGAREWLIMLPYNSATTNYFGYTFTGSSDSGAIDNYFRESDGTAATWSHQPRVAIHYNCGNESYGMGFDDTVALTYTGGDFQAPLHNPASAAHTDFMPATECLWGFYTINSWTNWDRVLFVFDEDSTSLTFYSTRGAYAVPEFLQMYGSLTVNTDGADTNTEATIGLVLDHGNGEWGEYDHTTSYAYNLSGIREYFDWSYVNSHYTNLNALNTAEEFKWKSITLSNTSYEKGIIDTNLVRQTGAFNSIIHYGKIIKGPNGPFYRCSYDAAFPYALNIERFPWPE